MNNFKQVRNDFVYRTGEEGPVTKVEVYYTKGGPNYFSGGQTARGIFISVRATKLEKSPSGYTVESFEIFGKGGKFLVKELARKSDKELARVAETLDEFAPAIATAFEADEAKGRDALIQAVKSISGQEQ
jgi:hypothetical protein